MKVTLIASHSSQVQQRRVTRRRKNTTSLSHDAPDVTAQAKCVSFFAYFSLVHATEQDAVDRPFSTVTLSAANVPSRGLKRVATTRGVRASCSFVQRTRWKHS